MMKKFIAMILALAVALSMCACGADTNRKDRDDNDDREETKKPGITLTPATPTQPSHPIARPAEPSQEELQMLHDYYELVNRLDNEDWFYIDIYDEKGECVKTLIGQEALMEMIARLQQMEAMDKWIGTAYHDPASFENAIEWDREKMLSRFTVVENVLMGIHELAIDHLDNVKIDDLRTRWYYGADGRLASASQDPTTNFFMHIYNKGEGFYEYDDQGRVTKIKYMNSYDEVQEVRIFTYDEQGNIVKEVLKDNYTEKEYTYSHNEEGLLAEIRWSGSYDSIHVISYTYDEDGRMTSETYTVYGESNNEIYYIDSIRTISYTYDESGKLVSGLSTEEAWKALYNFSSGEILENRVARRCRQEITFETDDLGRITGKTIICAPTYVINEDGSQGQLYGNSIYATETTKYIYGNYCVYTPDAA